MPRRASKAFIASDNKGGSLLGSLSKQRGKGKTDEQIIPFKRGWTNSKAASAGASQFTVLDRGMHFLVA
ncbi:hypothetical protein R1flu_014716 [Riccia fluitans]|uniref:Uncharacterized protein n=1 Tax=Riccia fluitans TaxID=41844 RepID=A0ABD1YH93_9MARC